MKFIQISSVLMVVSIFGCGKKESNYNDSLKDDAFNKCGFHGDQKCSTEEIAYIRDIQYLIAKVGDIAVNDTKLLEHFHIFSNHSQTQKGIHFIGENHIDLISMIDNYAYIEKTLKKGDVILFEGGPSGKTIDHGVESIFGTMRCVLEYDRKGWSYDPSLMDSFCATQVTHAFNTAHAIKYHVLNLNGGKFQYWDDPKSMEISNRVENLRKRNTSLVNTVNNVGSEQSTFVIAGNLHSPIGEYAKIKSEHTVGVGENVSSIYADFPNETTTGEIFNDFNAKNITYLSHKKLFSSGNLHLPKNL